MYNILFVFITISLLFELYHRKINSNLFYVVYLFMTFLVVFRYGQGTDYFGYMYYYDNVDLSSPVYQKDTGFALLCYICNSFRISYVVFSSVFAFITMLLYFPFFKNICRKSMLPLFIFYAYVFLIFPMSGIRQGFTIAVLLGVLYPLLIREKYLYFYIILGLASTIHLSLLICAILPFLLKMKFRKDIYTIFFIVATIINFLNINLYSYIPFELPLNRGIDLASAEDSANYFGKFFRFIIIIALLIIPDRFYKGNLIRIRNIVFTGYLIYSFLSFVGTVAGRIEIYFRVFEMLLLFLLLYKNVDRIIVRYAYLFLVLYTALFFKNIDSQIKQGDYIYTTILTYPYVSVFSPDNIYLFRKDVTIGIY